MTNRENTLNTYENLKTILKTIGVLTDSDILLKQFLDILDIRIIETNQKNNPDIG